MNKLIRLSNTCWADGRDISSVHVENHRNGPIVWVKVSGFLQKADILDGETVEEAVDRIATTANSVSRPA